MLLVGHLSMNTRAQLLPWTLLLTVASVYSLKPVKQFEEYYDFADQRSLHGVIPNFMDVISNFPFLVFGILGLEALHPAGLWPGFPGQTLLWGPLTSKNAPLGSWDAPVVGNDDERLAWSCFFAGIAAVSAGSAYFHWNITPATLVWDRLPITVAFLASMHIVLCERVATSGAAFIFGEPYPTGALPILVPMLLLGALSVFYWHWTEDLRPYIIVQGFPTLIIPVIMVAFPPKYTRDDLLIAAFSCNLLCKVCEVLDKPIWRATGRRISGHTLKHAWASLLPFVALYYLCARKQFF
jgi:hypothetical protein